MEATSIMPIMPFLGPELSITGFAAQETPNRAEQMSRNEIAVWVTDVKHRHIRWNNDNNLLPIVCVYC